MTSPPRGHKPLPPLPHPRRQAAGSPAFVCPWMPGCRRSLFLHLASPGAGVVQQRSDHQARQPHGNPTTRLQTDQSLLGNPRCGGRLLQRLRNPELLVDPLSCRCRTAGPFHIKKSQAPQQGPTEHTIRVFVQGQSIPPGLYGVEKSSRGRSKRVGTFRTCQDPVSKSKNQPTDPRAG